MWKLYWNNVNISLRRNFCTFFKTMPSVHQLFNVILKLHLYFCNMKCFRKMQFLFHYRRTHSTISQLNIKLNIVSSTPYRSKSEIILRLKYFQKKIYYNYYTDLDQQEFNLWRLLDQQEINSELETVRTAKIYHLLKWDKRFHNICLKLDYNT